MFLSSMSGDTYSFGNNCTSIFFKRKKFYTENCARLTKSDSLDLRNQYNSFYLKTAK